MAVEWMRLTIAGVEWRVDLCTAEEYPDLADRDGETDPDACRIVLQAAMPAQKRGVVLIHEILHACFCTPGEYELLAKLFGIDREKVEDAEELLVTHLAPKLTDALTRAKLLKLPRAPKAVPHENAVDTSRRRRATRRSAGRKRRR
jgi:hypothetical protein